MWWGVMYEPYIPMRQNRDEKPSPMMMMRMFLYGIARVYGNEMKNR